jgi:S-adenosylmethionine synthetase
MKRVLLFIGFILPLIPFSVYAQDARIATQSVDLQVAGSALLAVSGAPVKLILAGAVEAGDAIQQSTENDKSRLRISSLVNNGEKRAITAKISEALVGTTLRVELKEPNGNFVYPENRGTLTGEKLLSNETEVTLAEGIGTCWSGKTVDDGYVIRYVYKAIPNAPILKSATIIVTYTISTVASDSNV